MRSSAVELRCAGNGGGDGGGGRNERDFSSVASLYKQFILLLLLRRRRRRVSVSWCSPLVRSFFGVIPLFLTPQHVRSIEG